MRDASMEQTALGISTTHSIAGDIRYSAREKALSLSSCMLWTATFVVVLVSPYLLDFSPAFNFLLFAVLNVIGFVFIWFYLPEKKGRTLKDMEEIWEKMTKR